MIAIDFLTYSFGILALSVSFIIICYIIKFMKEE